jgi:hypothetical protein
MAMRPASVQSLSKIRSRSLDARADHHVEIQQAAQDLVGFLVELEEDRVVHLLVARLGAVPRGAQARVVLGEAALLREAEDGAQHRGVAIALRGDAGVLRGAQVRRHVHRAEEAAQGGLGFAAGVFPGAVLARSFFSWRAYSVRVRAAYFGRGASPFFLGMRRGSSSSSKRSKSSASVPAAGGSWSRKP